MTEAGVETGVHLRASAGEIASGDTTVFAVCGAGLFLAIADVLQSRGALELVVAARFSLFPQPWASSFFDGVQGS
jgi:hypothetical protein